VTVYQVGSGAPSKLGSFTFAGDSRALRQGSGVTLLVPRNKSEFDWSLRGYDVVPLKEGVAEATIQAEQQALLSRDRLFARSLQEAISRRTPCENPQNSCALMGTDDFRVVLPTGLIQVSTQEANDILKQWQNDLDRRQTDRQRP